MAIQIGGHFVDSLVVTRIVDLFTHFLQLKTRIITRALVLHTDFHQSQRLTVPAGNLSTNGTQ